MPSPIMWSSKVVNRLKQMAGPGVVVFLALLCLSACVWSQGARSTGSAPDRVSAQPDDLVESSATLGQDDVFEVRVYQESDLSGVYRVSSEGNIIFPLIGVVTVEDKTPIEIAKEIQQRLEADYLRRAFVSVFVKEFNSKKIFVFGEVQKPGTFRYEENMTIIQAITLAGGFTRTAAKNSVNVTRLVNGSETRLVVAVENIWKGREENIRLRPGDIVFVPETLF